MGAASVGGSVSGCTKVSGGSTTISVYTGCLAKVELGLVMLNYRFNYYNNHITKYYEPRWRIVAPGAQMVSTRWDTSRLPGSVSLVANVRTNASDNTPELRVTIRGTQALVSGDN